MSLTQITPPTAAVVSLGLLKQHLRLVDAAEDGYLQQLLDVAQEHCDGPDGDLGRALLTSTWRFALDAWPNAGKAIELPLPPLQSVDAITYVDANGATQTLAPSVYQVVDNGPSKCSQVFLATGQSWPTIRSQPAAILVTITAGWALPKDVPARIGQAILMMATHWYENRAPIGSTDLQEIPLGIRHLLTPLRVNIGGTVFG